MNNNCACDLQYRYIGEIDCPDDMLYEFATVKDLDACGGKSNWFLRSDGVFFACDDHAANSILDSDKLVNGLFPFEYERNEKYESMTMQERIDFRVDLQGITAEEARCIVCDELGIPAYKNTYKFSVKETHFNDHHNTEEVHTYIQCAYADTEESARAKVLSMTHAVGDVISTGRYFTEADNERANSVMSMLSGNYGTPFTVTLKNIEVILKDVIENI